MNGKIKAKTASGSNNLLASYHVTTFLTISARFWKDFSNKKKKDLMAKRHLSSIFSRLFLRYQAQTL